MIVSSSRQSSDSSGPSIASKANQRGTSSEMEWRSRSGEPGSTFRGSTKPRGSGRGGGRPGRGGGGRGGGRGPYTTDSGKTDKDAAPLVTASDTTPSSVKEVTPTPSTPVPSGRTSRQKTPRKVATATSEESLRPTPSQTVRPPNRRRRSHQNNKISNSASNPAINRNLTVEPGDRKALTGPSTPSVPAKDLPPHLASSPDTPSFDIRNNIDALVERVRAVAMDRPHTPGSHIDWARDDDDSLPDLDDWGVISSKGGSAHDELEKISPILEDTELTPLPNIPFEKVNVLNKGPSQDIPKQDPGVLQGSEFTPVAVPRTHKVEKVRSKRGTRSRGNSRAQQAPPAIEIKEPVSSDSPVSARSHDVLSPTTSLPHTAKPEPSPVPPSTPGKLPLHPSLPPKPVTSVEHVRPRGQNNAAAATPMRNPLPTKPVPKIVVDTLVQVEEQGASETLVSAAPEKKENVVEKDLSVLVPLQEPLPRPNSAPSRTFNPAHGRAHTLGRVGDIQPPHSAPISTFVHASQLGNLTPSKSFGAQHTRNHSSPPAANGFTRAPHLTRPVLTGDAISRLARTLGTGGSISPRREPTPVPLAKD